MQAKKIVYYSLLLLMLSTIFFAFIKLQREYSKLQKDTLLLTEQYHKDVKKYADFSSSLRYAWTKQLEISSKRSIATIDFFDKEKNLTISDILSNQDEPCLFVSNNMCDLCIHDIQSELEKLDFHTKCKVFVESESKQDFLLFSHKTFSSRFQYFGYKKGDVKFLKLSEKPLLAIVNKCGSMDLVFIPVVGLSNRTESWLKDASFLLSEAKCES